LSKTEKKEQGIYFTPPKTVQRAISLVKTFLPQWQNNPETILEPSCGSCEFIKELYEQFPQANITGIEYNQTIYEAVSKQYPNIIHHDYITFNHDNIQTYDLIIGNPPFYVMKKNDVDAIYTPFFDGRPNMFVLFILKSLGHLTQNGVLCFILPKNFLNCLYYDKTRKHIVDNFRIVWIEECVDDYLETKQETIILIVQNAQRQQNETPFYLPLSNYTIFGIPETLNNIRILSRNSSTLASLGFTVSVGTVVWNEWKDELSNDPSHTRLIYSSDIIDGQLSMKQYANEAKKNYINKQGITYSQIVLNRGYGVGKYAFQCCLITGGFEYLVENHLICIRHTDQSLYHKLMESFNDEKTKQFIDLYFGNNAINTTELANILPIYGF